MAVGTGWLGVESPACTLGGEGGLMGPSRGWSRSLSATHQGAMGGHRRRTVKKGSLV